MDELQQGSAVDLAKPKKNKGFSRIFGWINKMSKRTKTLLTILLVVIILAAGTVTYLDMTGKIKFSADELVSHARQAAGIANVVSQSTTPVAVTLKPIGLPYNDTFNIIDEKDQSRDNATAGDSSIHFSDVPGNYTIKIRVECGTNDCYIPNFDKNNIPEQSIRGNIYSDMSLTISAGSPKTINVPFTKTNYAKTFFIDDDYKSHPGKFQVTYNGITQSSIEGPSPYSKTLAFLTPPGTYPVSYSNITAYNGLDLFVMAPSKTLPNNVTAKSGWQEVYVTFDSEITVQTPLATGLGTASTVLTSSISDSNSKNDSPGFNYYTLASNTAACTGTPPVGVAVTSKPAYTFSSGLFSTDTIHPFATSDTQTYCIQAYATPVGTTTKIYSNWLKDWPGLTVALVDSPAVESLATSAPLKASISMFGGTPLSSLDQGKTGFWVWKKSPTKDCYTSAIVNADPSKNTGTYYPAILPLPTSDTKNTFSATATGLTKATTYCYFAGATEPNPWFGYVDPNPSPNHAQHNTTHLSGPTVTEYSSRNNVFSTGQFTTKAQ